MHKSFAGVSYCERLFVKRPTVHTATQLQLMLGDATESVGLDRSSDEVSVMEMEQRV